MSLNILVVDDSAVTRKMIIRTLQLTGLELGEVHEAQNGQEGISLLDEHWIDLAFVDLNMPVMNGEEMIEQVRSCPAWEDLPVVVVSTEGSETRVERLRQQGVKFVHKPFSPETIKQVVTTLLGVDNEYVHA